MGYRFVTSCQFVTTGASGVQEPAAAINGSATTRIAEYVNLRLIPTLLRLHECNYYSNVVKADEPY